uniref:hypothetical protein n=1 Tax=Lactiplantibacillus paraplantarum TaxID=60520 RepID=UPI000534D351
KQVDRSSESRRYKLPLGTNLYLYWFWCKFYFYAEIQEKFGYFENRNSFKSMLYLFASLVFTWI